MLSSGDMDTVFNLNIGLPCAKKKKLYSMFKAKQFPVTLSSFLIQYNKIKYRRNVKGFSHLKKKKLSKLARTVCDDTCPPRLKLL